METQGMATTNFEFTRLKRILLFFHLPGFNVPDAQVIHLEVSILPTLLKKGTKTSFQEEQK